MRRKISIWFLALMLLCSGCAQTQVEQEPPQEAVQTPEEQVLLALEATVDHGRTLRLEAVGQIFPTDYGTERYGIRAVQVYEGSQLLQTIDAREAIEAEWGSGVWSPAEDGFLYTDCWSPEDVMSVQDMNFDGCGDIALFGWIPNNSIPYYYWLWEPDTQSYRYAFTLQQAEAHAETQEVSSWYKAENGIYHTDYFQYDSAGALVPVRRQVENWQKGTGDTPLLETYEMAGGQWLLTETEETHG